MFKRVNGILGASIRKRKDEGWGKTKSMIEDHAKRFQTFYTAPEFIKCYCEVMSPTYCLLTTPYLTM